MSKIMLLQGENKKIVRLAIKKEAKIVERIKQSLKSSNFRPSILWSNLFIILIITISTVLGSASKVLINTDNNNGAKSNHQIANSIINQAAAAEKQQQKAGTSALEDELNSIVKQHDDGSVEANNRQLAETIISRLMIDNLTGSNVLNNNNDDNVILNEDDSQTYQQNNDLQQQNGAAGGEPNSDSYDQSTINVSNVYEALKLKRLLSMIQQYYENPNNSRYGAVAGELPLLPGGELATMKRATARLGNYLHNQRQTNGYPRNNFDFGLGKRPDGNVLRFGDSLTGAGLGTNGLGSGSMIQPVSQFGKRPSSHRYDFGLGKRVASPTYPRYDFGLGKRAPSRIRYDFGLGK